ncbi:MAG: hypothetical protein IPP94_17910 [Ignavibacteria bacterium]|nr:hypothetical protein [Ignavibacteria bacterium]
MKRTSSLMLAGVLLLLLASCTKKEDPVTPPPPAVSMTCIGCHGNEATLKAVADPNPPSDPGEGGCGGTLPEMEAGRKCMSAAPTARNSLPPRTAS